MRFFHISDLHIGKQLYSYSLGENQREILGEVVEKIKEYHPDALLICGDIFDRSIPSGEAYSIFDEFLTAVSGIKPEVTVLMIAGNHDSAERLRYASNFLRKHRITSPSCRRVGQRNSCKKSCFRMSTARSTFISSPS